MKDQNDQTHRDRKQNNDYQRLSGGGNGEGLTDPEFLFEMMEILGGGWWWQLQDKATLKHLMVSFMLCIFTAVLSSFLMTVCWYKLPARVFNVLPWEGYEKILGRPAGA